MRHFTALYVRHARLFRLAWVAALVVLAACENNTDGGGGGGGDGIY